MKFTLVGYVKSDMQATVDQTAAVFFNLVAERRGLTPETVAAYQAAVFVGTNALGVGLANSVESFSDFKNRLSDSRTPVVSTETPSMDEDKDKPKEDAVRAALVTASESDDAEKASKTKRALAAYDEEAKAEDEKPEPKDDDEDSKAVAKAVAPLAKQLAAQQAELASLKAEADVAKRSSIFAARKDLSPELIASLKASLAASMHSNPRSAKPEHRSPEWKRLGREIDRLTHSRALSNYWRPGAPMAFAFPTLGTALARPSTPAPTSNGVHTSRRSTNGCTIPKNPEASALARSATIVLLAIDSDPTSGRLGSESIRAGS